MSSALKKPHTLKILEVTMMTDDSYYHSHPYNDIKPKQRNEK